MQQPLREAVERHAAPYSNVKITFLPNGTNFHVLKLLLADIGRSLADVTDYTFYRADGFGADTIQCAVQKGDRMIVSDVTQWPGASGEYYQIKNDLRYFLEGKPDYGQPMFPKE